MQSDEESKQQSEGNLMEDEGKFHDSIMKEIADIKLQILEIRKDIKYSVTPKFLDISTQTNDLIELAIELWRLEHKINRILPSLPKDQQEGLSNSLGKLTRYLGKNDIEVLDHTNQKYDDGLNLEILAVEKDSNLSEASIKETKEPTILYKGQVIHIGKVIVASKEDIASTGA